MEVIAEGVETREELEKLAEMNCNYIQGFHYSKPLPIAEAIEFVRQY